VRLVVAFFCIVLMAEDAAAPFSSASAMCVSPQVTCPSLLPMFWKMGCFLTEYYYMSGYACMVRCDVFCKCSFPFYFISIKIPFREQVSLIVQFFRDFLSTQLPEIFTSLLDT
jgi:hypothetical protein